MRVLLSVLSFCCFSTIALSAQDTSSRKVYLNDGSVLIGQVIEDNDYFIRIVIATGDTLKIGYKNINTSPSEVTMEITARGSANTYRWTNRPKTFLESGYMYGGNLGVGFTDGNSAEIQGFFGKRLSPRWNTGIGVNFARRSFRVGDLYEDVAFVTPTLFTRYYLNRHEKLRWFVLTEIGYAISTNDDYVWQFDEHSTEGGIYGRAGVGIHFPSKRNMRWFIDFGLSYQKSSGIFSFQSDPFGSGTTPLRVVYNKTYLIPHIGIGIEF